MDYIVSIKENVLCSSANNIISVIHQESIRYPKFKILAVYTGDEYKGTYQIITKEIFEVKDISETYSLLFFGCHKSQAIYALKKIPVKGRFSMSMLMAVYTLQWIKYDEKYDI